MVKEESLTLTAISVTCFFKNVVCGVYCDLLDKSTLLFWGNIGWPANKVHTGSCWGPKALEMALGPYKHSYMKLANLDEAFKIFVTLFILKLKMIINHI